MTGHHVSSSRDSISSSRATVHQLWVSRSYLVKKFACNPFLKQHPFMASREMQNSPTHSFEPAPALEARAPLTDPARVGHEVGIHACYRLQEAPKRICSYQITCSCRPAPPTRRRSTNSSVQSNHGSQITTTAPCVRFITIPPHVRPTNPPA